MFKAIPTALYITDNGAILCGRDLGASARSTGRDISGQEIHLITDTDVAAWIAEAGSSPSCETCGHEHR